MVVWQEDISALNHVRQELQTSSTRLEAANALLTEEGEAYAKVVWRSHRALRTFLEHDLGVKPEIADEEACLMEHVLSGDTMQRLIGYLERQGVEIPKE